MCMTNIINLICYRCYKSYIELKKELITYIVKVRCQDCTKESGNDRVLFYLIFHIFCIITVACIYRTNSLNYKNVNINLAAAASCIGNLMTSYDLQYYY